MRLGLLSTARINRRVIAAAGATDAVDVVAVASRDGARAEGYAREHGIPRAHGSYAALLADPEVDAVYVALPNALHVEWSIAALEAGKHVLCEKPLTRRAADAERAFDAAERAGRVLMEGLMWRHVPQTQRLLELLPAIGRLRAVRAHFSFPQPAPGNVRLSAALEGGALMDVGCYCVSALRLVAGEPEAVAAHQVLGGDGVDVAFAAALRFPGGVLGHFDCGMSMAFRHELEVVGTDGALFVADPWQARRPVIELRTGDGVEHVEAPSADAFARELEALASGAPPYGRADAVAQARALEALYAAAAS